MRFALLGDDPQALALARAVVEGRHELVWIGEASAGTETLQDLAPRAERSGLWESLLDQQIADVVIVGRSTNEDLRAEQLRKLVQVGVPLLISHPICASMLVYYELDMIRRESDCIMRHYWPGTMHPAVTALASVVAGRSGEIGAVEQIVFERTLPVRDKRTVLEQFARDVDLVAQISGDIDKIGALGASDDEASYATLGIQMSGVSSIGARWSVQPVVDEPGGTLSLLGENGRAVLHMPTTSEPWTLEQTAAGGTETTAYTDWDAPAAAIDAMVEAVGQHRGASTWSEAARTVELAEAAERSLKKGRTIELYEQEFSEESTFKGMMTSMGCGLLIATLIVVALLTVLAAVLKDLGVPMWVIESIGSWPLLILVVFVLFLLLQLLPKLVLPARGDQSRKR